MKISFLVHHGFSETSGISKKIHYQVKGLRENGHEVHLCYYDFSPAGHRCRYVDDKVLADYGSGKMAAFRQRIDYGSIFDYCRKNKIEFVYARSFHNASLFLIHFFRRLMRAHIRSVIEIPTFPYEAEYIGFPLIQRLGLHIDQLFRHRLAHLTDAIVTFSDATTIFGQKTLISIIIPHKNIPDLLERCLASIPIQDNIEIIIVDDDSDNIDEKSFPGVDRSDTTVIFTHEGKGAGYARNVGLEHAKGEWVIFADSDDFFMSDSFVFFEKYISKEYDIVFFNAYSLMSDSLEPSNRTDDYSEYFHQDINEIRYKSSVPWAKLIRRSVITDNNIRFSETPVANDAYFSCQLAIKASKVGIDSHMVYCNTERYGSLYCKKQTKNDRIIRVSELMKCNILLRKNGKKKYLQSGFNWIVGDGTIREWLPFYYMIKYLYPQIRNL